MALELFASCLKGFEKLLAEELRGLGADRIRPLSGGVAFFGGERCAYSACLWSRIASRITLVLSRFDAHNAEELYQGVASLPWEDILAPGASFTTKAHGSNQELRNTRFVALKAKDAIVDRLRPMGWSAHSNPRQRAGIDIRIRNTRATVSFDLSGEALNRRSYLLYDDRADAPLECSLAAGCLALADWPRNDYQPWAMVDPICRSGIFLIEAAMRACDKAPGLDRDSWGFECWRGYDRDLWLSLQSEAKERFRAGRLLYGVEGEVDSPLRETCFLGLSTSSPSIAAARKRVRAAGLRGIVGIEIGDGQVASDAVDRVQASARALQPDLDPGCAVVARFQRESDARDRARIQTDSASFLTACEAVPSSGPFLAIDGEAVALRFPDGPSEQLQVGTGRSLSTLAVYDHGPLAATSIEIVPLGSSTPVAVAVSDPTADQFAARLRKVAKERRRWAEREGITSYRIYDSDLPEYAVAVDCYEGAGDAKGNHYLHIAEYAPPASVDPLKAQRRFEDVLSIAPRICGVRPDHVFAKQRRRSKGGSQYGTQKSNSYRTTIEEDGHLLEVELARYLDTGIFLDHRLTRRLVASRAKGKRFLNLFAYTGTASVHAAAGGAASTTTVDLSQTYLDWARRNMEANGFDGNEHSFIKADTMRFITDQRRKRARYDLIFIDPPTFSNSKSMGKKTWDVQRDHVELLIGATHLLSDGGEIIFSCNLRSFKPDVEELARHGIEIEDISLETIPEDFVRTPKIHKCFIVRRNTR